MPRFNPKHYSPTHDSSSGFKDRAKREGVLVVDQREAPASQDGDSRVPCLCGCGHVPEGKKSKFMMGHDARYRGMLIRAHLTDTAVVIVTRNAENGIEGSLPSVPAMTLAKREKWDSYLKNAEVRREGKNREVVHKALNSKRLIKVGRWEKTGQVVAVYQVDGEEQYDIEYVTKTGDKRKARVPATQAKEVE